MELKSKQNSQESIPLETLETWASGARLGNRSAFILDSRLPVSSS